MGHHFHASCFTASKANASGLTIETSHLCCAKQDDEHVMMLIHLLLNNSRRQMPSALILAQETRTQMSWLDQDHTEFEIRSLRFSAFSYTSCQVKQSGLSSEWQASSVTCNWVGISTCRLGAWSKICGLPGLHFLTCKKKEREKENTYLERCLGIEWNDILYIKHKGSCQTHSSSRNVIFLSSSCAYATRVVLLKSNLKEWHSLF